MTLELQDFKHFGPKETTMSKYKRLDGKKKLIMSISLKALRKKFIEECKQNQTFKQSTNPRFHILKTQVNQFLFRKLLDNKKILKKQLVIRGFEDSEDNEEYLPDNKEIHNQVFSLMYKGGITKQWIDVINGCRLKKTFVSKLISTIQSSQVTEEYKLKIKSMIKSISKYPNCQARIVQSPEELLDLVEQKYKSKGICESNGKAPLSILELEELKTHCVEKLQKVFELNP